ncbi:MAG: hemerythrin domain-containing protein [Betaproteobacteria bacterium]
MSAYEIAAATIKQEHHTLSVVVEMAQRLLADIERQHAVPDFALFAAALLYIDDFPDRCHHPKEDKYLFDALRRRTTAFDSVLDELQADHVRSSQMLTYMERALVRYQAGRVDGLSRFKDAVDAYAVLLSQHMRSEEELLDRARDILTEEDWQRIAAAFEANDDPMTGANGREEFRKLYLRILTLLPRKIRLLQKSHNIEE